MVPMTFIWWIYHFWARFWPYFNFVDFRAYFGPFPLVNRVQFSNADAGAWNSFLRLGIIFYGNLMHKDTKFFYLRFDISTFGFKAPPYCARPKKFEKMAHLVLITEGLSCAGDVTKLWPRCALVEFSGCGKSVVVACAFGILGLITICNRSYPGTQACTASFQPQDHYAGQWYITWSCLLYRKRYWWWWQR